MEFTRQPLEPFGETLLRVEVPTNLAYKSPLVFRLTQTLEEKKYIRPETRRLAELCFDEALANAMVHGNRRDPEKMVRLHLFGDGERWGLLLEDEGEGFGPEDVPDVSGENPLEDIGRGILLMDGYVDSLRYNATGNALLMVRHRETDEEVRALTARQAPAPEAAVTLQPSASAGEAAEDALTLTEIEEDEDLIVGFAEARKEGDVAVVEIQAKELSDANVDILKAEVNSALSGCTSLLIDLSKVTYVSSVIIGAFASFLKHVRSRGGDLKVCGVQPVVMKVFQIVRFDRMMEFLPDQASALERFRSA